MLGAIAKAGRRVLARDATLVRRMGTSDVAFLLITVAGLLLFGWLAVTETPFNGTATLGLVGGFLSCAAWYLLVGLRRKQLLSYFREAIEKTPTAFAVYDESDRLIACNRAYESAHQSAFGGAEGPITYEDVIRADFAGRPAGARDDAAGDAELASILKNHQEASGLADDRASSDGRWFRVVEACTESGAYVSTAMDVTELHDAKAAADREHARFRGLAETLPVGIWQFDAEGRTIFVNRGLLDLFGIADRSELDRVPALQFLTAHVTGFDAARLNADHNELGNLAIRTGDGGVRHIILRTSDLPAEATSPGETIMSFIDVTPLKEAERRIDYLAHRDTLTGVRNRAAFTDAIERAAEIATNDSPNWMLAMDLDGFKPVNDQYGHAAGDQLMREFADRVQHVGRSTSFLYRLGGDEFGLIQMSSPREQVEDLAAEIVAAISEPFQIGHNRINVGVSIGIASMPGDARDAETAQRYADLALYSVKKRGGRDFAFFTREHAERDIQERVITLDLSRALASDEFEFVFQPVFRRSDRAVVGAEALLRWTNDRTGKTVPPRDFIAAAERSGIICRMDHWVISRAARQISEWLDRGADPALVMINMSSLTLLDDRFIARIDEVLAKHPRAAGRICLEITENLVTDSRDALRDTFQALHERGIRTAIDNFGTGQTSVSLLRDFPLSFIKLDRSYTAVTQTDRQAMAIVRTIVQLSRELGVRTIGEGVETQEHLEVLSRMGCEMFQGHLGGRPVTAREIEVSFLRTGDATVTRQA